jgi:RimJ/RimL family protein N-acetyltransferase
MTVEAGGFPGPGPVRLAGEGLVLREWRAGDVPRMTELFDEPQVQRWTPLASPFDVPAATAYLERAADRRRTGSALQLAITEDGDRPLGEVLLFLHPGVAEVGWALGADHRGRRLASRAVRVLLAWATAAGGIDRFRALIEPGNTASERVATACGFAASCGSPVMVESRRGTVGLTAWLLTAADASSGRRVTRAVVEPVTQPLSVAGEAPASG